MTAVAGDQRTAAQLALVGGALGMVAGAVQSALGSRIPNWTGNKDNPLGLGLLTILLSVAAIGAASTLRTKTALSAGVRGAVAIVLLVAGGLCFSTVGRLWYIPGVLLLGAFGFTVAAGGTSELRAVIRVNLSRGLVSVLGAFQVLMAVSAGPAITITVGVIGGIALIVAPWLRGQNRMIVVLLMLIGTVPFAAFTWWSLVTPLLAGTALAIGLSITHRDDRSNRAAHPVTFPIS